MIKSKRKQQDENEDIEAQLEEEPPKKKKLTMAERIEASTAKINEQTNIRRKSIKDNHQKLKDKYSLTGSITEGYRAQREAELDQEEADHKEDPCCEHHTWLFAKSLCGFLLGITLVIGGVFLIIGVVMAFTHLI